ncbi:hypothetical protein BKA69DRAFT_1122867 [Paraphysoderma sedebokerense]|nr:hypothetical protein BKA69DRAFT_1122867 [Paraphysoderma sedebokerense]
MPRNRASNNPVSNWHPQSPLSPKVLAPDSPTSPYSAAPGSANANYHVDLPVLKKVCLSRPGAATDRANANCATHPKPEQQPVQDGRGLTMTGEGLEHMYEIDMDEFETCDDLAPFAEGNETQCYESLNAKTELNLQLDSVYRDSRSSNAKINSSDTQGKLDNSNSSNSSGDGVHRADGMTDQQKLRRYQHITVWESDTTLLTSDVSDSSRQDSSVTQNCWHNDLPDNAENLTLPYSYQSRDTANYADKARYVQHTHSPADDAGIQHTTGSPNYAATIPNHNNKTELLDATKKVNEDNHPNSNSDIHLQQDDRSDIPLTVEEALKKLKGKPCHRVCQIATYINLYLSTLCKSGQREKLNVQFDRLEAIVNEVEQFRRNHKVQIEDNRAQLDVYAKSLQKVRMDAAAESKKLMMGF